MDFQLSQEQRHLQQRCQQLAKDFATRSATHDREASHPSENYQRLREEGFLAFNVPKERGGPGISFVAHTVAFEALAQGCPATALAFNMHASMVGPLLETDEVTDDAKAHLTHLVLKEQMMIAGNFSEASSTALLGARPLGARATKVDGGYVINGRKMFASMLEAADYCAVMTYPDGATSPHAGIILLVPKVAEGRSVEANWDPLGMRATRSDSLILKDCWVPDSARVYQSDDIRAFRRAYTNWFWASYSAVYLGIAAAAFEEIVRIVSERTPEGYSQSLAYHPDVRNKVAKMSAELEAARLITYHSAWLSDSEGPTDKTTAALFRAKYVIGEAVTSITRCALTLGGTHAIFKGSRLEQLFRDGALGPIQPPQTDFCLFNMSLFELGLDEADLMSPLKAL
ncbi:MAG: alkylation response protein AidB-like acyl-CoA dehydrogenase [Gammaproteobacteria bacterium]|jgi:alkylation response protein AidB-like acyl-CoA dehydrogenase